MKRAPLPDHVLRALANADRAPGWNNRSPQVQRFHWGACVLYVVPFRRWAYRRNELNAQAWRDSQAQA
jgi:hypothetical protein